MIPKSYSEWHHCIVNECKIDLTTEFISQRLAVLNNPTHQETKRLISLYGKDHHNKLISWFNTANSESVSMR